LVVVLPPEEPAPGTWSTSGGAWLHVTGDGIVTAFTGKVDVGQDNRTALGCSLPRSFTCRSRVFVSRWAIPTCALTTWYLRQSFHARRRESAQLCRRVRPLSVAVPVGTRRVEIVTGEPAVTAPSNWRIAGTAHIPTRTLDAVTGGLRFVTDLSMPGLRHGAMLRAPVLDSKLVHLRTDALDSIGDVVVARTSSGIGVVAGDRVQVRAALACLEATWDIPGAPSDDDLDEFLRSHP